MTSDAAKTYRQKLKNERRRRSEAIKGFEYAVRIGNGDRLGPVLSALAATKGYPGAFRRVRGTDAPIPFREGFLGYWAHDGEHIRGQINDDLLLIDALKGLLPPYAGPDMELWRGESHFAWARRRYGLSWTSDREVATDFARMNQQWTEKGGVLLQARVPSAAIIAHVSDFGEEEYLVDRRLLPRPIVVAARYLRPAGGAL